MTFKTTVERKVSTRNLSESLYSEWDGEKFSNVSIPKKKLPSKVEKAYEEFRGYINQNDFSCIGAKSALHEKSFRIVLYQEINSPETTIMLGRDLSLFAAEQSESASNFASFAVMFEGPKMTDEKMWEDALWKQLENLHRIDPSSTWDSSVSSDPENPDFSFSFAGMGFFIVGLHPQSSRFARRFARPAIVFNPHAQFDRLRETNQYKRMQNTIRAREMKLQGSLNPNLSDFGMQSEARQYSGRAVEENWKCPFQALMRDSEK